MPLKTFAIVTAAAGSLAVVALRGAPAAGPVEFIPHDINASFRGGYAVGVADFNKDGKIDVIANSLQLPEVAWHENPTWERHVIVSDTPSIVNQAMADIDGDGIPEIAYQSGFAMQAASSAGITWLARSQGDPRKPWKAEKVDEFPTSHHVQWGDLDGDGKKELLNAPLIGPKSLAPTYDQDTASVFWYAQNGWKRRLVADDIPGIIHRVRPVNWDDDRREEFLVASFEGIVLYKAAGRGDNITFQKIVLSSGHSDEKAPRLGASDVGVGAQDGRKFFASVEPWHGNEVVVYNEVGGTWRRRVIFDKVASGHEVAVVDLNGDGRGDVIANDNSRSANRPPPAARGGAQPAAGRAGAAPPRPPSPGVHVFYAPDDPVTGEWKYQRIETQLGMNSCVAADINSDRRPDLVCTGSGGVIRWYENTGRPATPTTAQ